MRLAHSVCVERLARGEHRVQAVVVALGACLDERLGEVQNLGASERLELGNAGLDRLLLLGRGGGLEAPENDVDDFCGVSVMGSGAFVLSRCTHCPLLMMVWCQQSLASSDALTHSNPSAPLTRQSPFHLSNHVPSTQPRSNLHHGRPPRCALATSCGIGFGDGQRGDGDGEGDGDGNAEYVSFSD
jgi:hypothetical protein